MVVPHPASRQTRVTSAASSSTPTAATVSGVALLDLTALQPAATRAAVAELEFVWPGSVVQLRVGPLSPFDVIGCLDLLVDVTLRRRLNLEVHAAPHTLGEWMQELRQALNAGRVSRACWGTP